MSINMIIRVPEHKKIYYSQVLKDNTLNESKGIRGLNDLLGDDRMRSLRDKFQWEYVESLIPHAKEMLYYLDVTNYDIEVKFDGLVVNVNDHLFLPNRNLNVFKNEVFTFGEVKGNVNLSGNKLTDWTIFPKIIYGNCEAQYNFIKSFDGAPEVHGKMRADRQNKKPRYPLTDENYRLYCDGQLTENYVYLLDENTIGKLKSINENDGTCIVSVNGKNHVYDLDRVEYFGNIENLFI